MTSEYSGIPTTPVQHWEIYFLKCHTPKLSEKKLKTAIVYISNDIGIPIKEAEKGKLCTHSLKNFSNLEN